MFREINFRDIKENPVKALAEDWALVAAGDGNRCNAMTVSWGGTGELWGRDVVFVFIRPQRFTKGLVDDGGFFSLNFFDGCKKQLGYFGKASGRDEDKFEKSGFSPAFSDGTVYVEQARLAIICKKIACFDLDERGFLDESIMENYSAGDFHTMYVGEIVRTLEKIDNAVN